MTVRAMLHCGSMIVDTDMRFEIITIFPGFFAGFFEHGIVRKAQAGGLVSIGVHDLRAFTHDRHRTVDDRPFGGGEGMVLKPEPMAEALGSLGIFAKAEHSAAVPTHRDETTMNGAQTPNETNGKNGMRVILLSAQGRPFTQAVARELAGLERVVLICGRYEGVDERINELYCDMELSIGDYVLARSGRPGQ
jgi:tRNA (guanine37-N1)-methyltransferase